MSQKWLLPLSPIGVASRNHVQAAMRNKYGVSDGVVYMYIIEITARL